ncbi:MAG: ParB/RepB/Spo0J family partition protein [Actinobacteria bacterium]|nr:ParB/RepB/Spo0J family partition protein [Actinomycetota bacterium]
MQRKGLGKGLSALIPALEGSAKIIEVEVDDILPNPRQPRRRFDEVAISELAASIKEHGLIQPVVVRQAGSQYELVAGERRLRAARAAGLTCVPAVVRSSTDLTSLEIALVENVQREDLNALEEATAYHQLTEEFGLTQEELADKVGKSRSAIANSLRLLQLPDSIQGLLQLGALTAGHARAILSLDDEEKQLKLAEKVTTGGLSVRQTESLAKLWSAQPAQQRSPLAEREELGRTIGRDLGARVKVKIGKAGRGRIEIHFNSLDELERLSRRLAPGAVQRFGTVDHS